MENINPYERKQKSQAELFQEKVQKRNETEEWIFGNSFNKSGNVMPIRDNQGNIISYQKEILNNNIYTPNDFSRINNSIYFNTLNNSNFNQFNQGNIPNQNYLSKNYIQLQNNNNLGLLGNNMKYLNENQKDQNDINYSLLNKNKIPNIQFQNLPNTPYLLDLPPSSMNPIYSPINIAQTLNNGYYPQNLYTPNLNNNYYNKNINNVGNNPIRNSNLSFFGAESKKREEQKSLEMQQYRNELIAQINEKRIRDEETKRKMEEENRLEDIKNLEYRLMKDLQAEEQERKLREKINKRIQDQDILKDFEKVNTSFQDASFIKNNIDNNNEIAQNDENYINIEENIYEDNMLLNQDNYMRKIDADYQVLRQLINNDIDKRINDKINIINNEDFIRDINKERKINMIKKQNQLADYIMGDMHSPPTPIKIDTTKSYNIYNNPLSHSYSQKSKFPMKSYLNIQRIENIQNITNNMFNSFKNKDINLEDFFNRDKDENDFNVKEAIQKNEAHSKVDQDYSEIFKALKEANKYTKKYTNTQKNKDDISDNTSYTIYSDDSSIKKRHKTNYKSQKMSNTGYKRSYANSSLHSTKYDKNQKMKEQDKIINKNETKKDDNSNNEAIDEHSVRTTGIKNFTKTVLDKELKNIQENKEDEEDEEKDEQKDKTKQENEIENNENEVDLKNDKDENNENGEEENEDEEREEEEDEKEEEEEKDN